MGEPYLVVFQLESLALAAGLRSRRSSRISQALSVMERNGLLNLLLNLLRKQMALC